MSEGRATATITYPVLPPSQTTAAGALADTLAGIEAVGLGTRPGEVAVLEKACCFSPGAYESKMSFRCDDLHGLVRGPHA